MYITTNKDTDFIIEVQKGNRLLFIVDELSETGWLPTFSWRKEVAKGFENYLKLTAYDESNKYCFNNA